MQKSRVDTQKNRSPRSEQPTVNHDNRISSRYRAAPEVICIDDLGTMLDDALTERRRELDNGRERAYSSGDDVRPWEREVAYVTREQRIRWARREQHTDYLRKIDNENNLLEAGLPAGDFDNAAYVFAATGGRPRWE